MNRNMLFITIVGLFVLTCAACLEQPYRACDTGLVCQLGYECSPKGDFCALRNGCGNGRMDPGEVCDHGNRVSGDGCNQSCTSDESCGNGIRDQSESCDDGNRVSDDGCSRNCSLEHCGNGEPDSGEVCDDGNSDTGDGCSADCLSVETCGNGYVDIAGEESCDDGNIEDGDGCSADCLDENCGNGVVDSGEYCDDGNTENGDGCSADCKSDETCGNQVVDFSTVEQCDDGNRRDGDGCNADCRRSTCGNGTLDMGEACDDGDTASGDGCDADCLYAEVCGNGVLDPGEMCDPGSGAPCSADCSSDLACSNGYYDLDIEACDDRGNSPYCDFDCTRVWCGDGIQNEAAGETCDGGPSLVSVVVSGIAPAIELMPGMTEYVIELPLSQQSVTVTAIVATPGDTLAIRGVAVASGAPSAEIPLGLGDTAVDIVVENPLGVQRMYRLTLRRAAQLAQYAYGKASNASAGDYFGNSVALMGDTLAVGANYEDSAATGVNGNQADNSAADSGAVYVFRRAGATWQQEAYLKASNTDDFDHFGSTLALAGDTLAVGARYEDSAATGVNGNQADNSAADSGAVYVFRRTGATWQQEAYLKASNTAAGDFFGWNIVLAGDILSVAAYYEDSAATGINGNQASNSATNSGAVYVFRRAGTLWEQEAYLKASNTGAGDEFGWRMALWDDTLVVAARSEDSSARGINGDQSNNSASTSGAVYVFRRTGTTWAQEAYLKASNTDADDQFGRGVALSGDILAVGARGEASAATGVNGNQADNSAPDSGAVYVFRRTGTTWEQEVYLKASNTEADDEFGYRVVLAGDILAVGAPGEDSAARDVNGDQADNSTPDSGAVYVFRYDGTAWEQEAYLKASNTGTGDRFGQRVELSGDTLVVGVEGEDSAAQGVGGNPDDESAGDSGAVYIFH